MQPALAAAFVSPHARLDLRREIVQTELPREVRGFASSADRVTSIIRGFNTDNALRSLTGETETSAMFLALL